MMETLSLLLDYLSILLIAVTGIFVIWLMCFCIQVVKRRCKMRNYNKFVENCYTSLQKETPNLILRIQNAHIRDYNILSTWTFGKFLHLKKFPEKNGKVMKSCLNDN